MDYCPKTNLCIDIEILIDTNNFELSTYKTWILTSAQISLLLYFLSKIS